MLENGNMTSQTNTLAKILIVGVRRSAGKRKPDSTLTRQGALLSAELVFVLPLLMGIFFALVEVGMLWTANHRLAAAARAACRAAAMPGAGHNHAEHAAIRSLGRPALVKAHKMRMYRGPHTGDPVWIELRVPMKSAAPDMFWFLGFGLGNRHLVAQCVMRCE